MSDVKTWTQRAKDWLMTELDNLKEIRLALYNAHILHGVRPLPEVLNMMTELLEDYDAQEVKAAIRIWNSTPPEKGHKPRPPSPCELIGIMRPKPTTRQEATEVANSLFSATSDIGAHNIKKAERLMPSIGMDVVRRMYGGWYSFVRSTDDLKDPSTFKAQLRDSIEGALNSRGMQYAAQAAPKALPQHAGFDELPVSDHVAVQPFKPTEIDITGKEEFTSAGRILEMLMPRS